MRWWRTCIPVRVGVAVETLGQFDGSVVRAVQLVHNEGQIGGETRSHSESPEQGWDVHQHGYEQEDVGEKLQARGRERKGGGISN